MIEIHDIKDIEQAAPLLAELRPSLDPSVFDARLTAAVADGYRLIGATRGDDLVGILGYRTTRDVCWGHSFYVDDLNVAPTARATGVGGQLISAAKTRAVKLGCDHMRLCSGLTRKDAHRFYEAHDLKGFSKQFVLALKGD